MIDPDYYRASNILVSHYEAGGTPEDSTARKLLLDLGRNVLADPAIQNIATRYGITFEEVCIICESAWSLMPNPCVCWRMPMDGYSEISGRVLASMVIFDEPERFENLARKISAPRAPSPLVDLQRISDLSDACRREVREIAETRNKQFGAAKFQVKPNRSPHNSQGCLVLLAGCLGAFGSITFLALASL